jgi:hypothetical protein
MDTAVGIATDYGTGGGGVGVPGPGRGRFFSTPRHLASYAEDIGGGGGHSPG